MIDYTETTGTVADLEAQLEVARQAQHATERAAAVAAAQARVGAYQDWLAGYDPMDLRAAVTSSWAAAVAAVRGPGFTAALAEHVRTIFAECRQNQLALDAIAAGAAPSPGIAPGMAAFRDGDGSSIGEDMGAAVAGLTARAVLAAADEDTAAEVAAVHARAEQAYRAELLGAPAGFRVTASRHGDWVDVVGGAGAVRFCDSVAYLMIAELGAERVASIVRYMRSVVGYDLVELYDPEIPPAHVEALRRLAQPS